MVFAMIGYDVILQRVAENDPKIKYLTIGHSNLSRTPVSDIDFMKGNTHVTYLNLTANANIRDFSMIHGSEYIKKLDMNEMLLTEHDLSFTSTMRKLTQLSLVRNCIGNVSFLSTNHNISRLFLSENLISNLDFMIGNATIEMLYIKKNRLTSVEPLRGNRMLSTLDISGNNIVDLSPLAETSLVYLLANGCGVYDLSFISSMKSIAELYMNSNPISFIPSIASLSSLYFVQMECCDIDNIDFMRGNTSVRYLHLSRNRIETLEPLRGNHTLETLKISSNPVKDASPLFEMSGLTELWRHDTDNIIFADIRHTLLTNNRNKKNRRTSYHTLMLNIVKDTMKNYSREVQDISFKLNIDYRYLISKIEKL